MAAPEAHLAQALAFLTAIQAGDVDGVERLLNEGFDANTPLPGDGTLSEQPPVLFVFKAPAATQQRLLVLMLHHGANPNASWASRYAPGSSLLCMAALKGHYGMVNTLLKAGADPNWSLADAGRSALALAITSDWTYRGDETRQRVHPVSLFLSHGADPNGAVSAFSMQRPLHLAAEILDVEAMMALLAAGADPDPPGIVITPLWRIFSKLLRLNPRAVAIPLDIVAVVSLLLSSGARSDPLLYPPPEHAPVLPALIALCTHSPSQLSRLALKCLSIVIVAARHTLHLPAPQAQSLTALFRSYLAQYSPLALQESDAGTDSLVALALRISPVCYGRRLR